MEGYVPSGLMRAYINLAVDMMLRSGVVVSDPGASGLSVLYELCLKRHLRFK